jgi:hypothetical protein
VCLRAGLEEVAKRKKSHYCSCQGLNPGRTAPSLASIPTELHRLHLIKLGAVKGVFIFTHFPTSEAKQKIF